MSDKSLLELAVDVIKDSKEPIPFKDLFNKAIELSGKKYSEAEKRSLMAPLYTELTFDGRVFSIDNKWDLKDRHKFEQYYRDTSVLEDTEEESDDEEEKALQQEELGDIMYDEKADSEDGLDDFENKKSPEEDY